MLAAAAALTNAPAAAEMNGDFKQLLVRRGLPPALISYMEAEGIVDAGCVPRYCLAKEELLTMLLNMVDEHRRSRVQLSSTLVQSERRASGVGCPPSGL